MASVGWWALDDPMYLADGRHVRARWGGRKPIRVSTDHRLRHMYCVGSSGSGKSRFLRHLLLQDVRANRAFTLIDPHGDLGHEILRVIAELAFGRGPVKPEELGDKLVIVEPGDQRFGVPGINLLETGPGQVPYQLVDGIIETLRELWPDCYGPRLEDICRHALLLLQELGLTVAELVPLLSDSNVRTMLVAHSQSPDVRLFFEGHLGGLRAAEMKTWLESSRNKWSAFVSSPFIRPILGQARSTINFRQILDQGKWLIVNVSRDKLKESRRLLGALLVTLLHQASIARERMPPDQRIAHFLYVDEVPEFWTPACLHILEGARKHGLGLVLAHQNLTQPPFDERPASVDTILANTHTRLAFAVSHKDALRLAGEMFRPTGAEIKFQEQNLLGIPTKEPRLWTMDEEVKHYAGELMEQRPAELMIHFKGLADVEPYAARVPHVPDVRIDDARVDLLRRHVGGKYYRPLAEVERQIQERWAALRRGEVPRPLVRVIR